MKTNLTWATILLVVLANFVSADFLTWDREEAYDYIVVGSGPAGSTAAGRLAEELPCDTTLLLERGPDLLQTPNPPAILYADGLIYVAQNFDNLTEVLLTTPQPNAFNRVLNTNVGAMVGGGGSRNAFGYYVPSNATMDGWNLPGWGAAQLLPEFRRVESRVGITDLPYVGNTPTQDQGIKGYNSFGVRNNTGNCLNGDTQGVFTGAWTVSGPNTFPTERRSAYFQWVMNSPKLNVNLFVKTYTTVQRVIFNFRNEAIGVTANDATGKIVFYRARKEVIVAAGTFKTAQLLQLSGIGDARALLKKFILPRYHNPNVGQNLWYHLSSSQFYIYNPAYNVNGGTVADLSTSVRAGLPGQSLNDQPDWFLAAAQLTVPIIPGFDRVGIVENLIGGLYSTGSVKIDSLDIRVPPIINYNLFNDSRDLGVAVQALGYMQTVLQQPDFAQVYLQRVLPPPEIDLTNPQIAAGFAMQALSDAYHTGGVTKMGVSGDKTRVIDLNCNVVGVKRLRVVDLSGVPSRPKVNTQAIAMAWASNCVNKLLASRDSC